MKIRSKENIDCEIEIGKELDLDGEIFICIEAVEQACSGGYCGECAISFHTPSHGSIDEDCGMPSHITCKYHDGHRKDGKNIIFVTKENYEEFYRDEEE